MSKKPNSKREIIPLDEVPRSGTPESASKRQRISRSTSKAPVPDSSRSDESEVREIRGVKASKAGATESSSIVRPARTLAPTLSSDQPASVAMAHLSVARSSPDPSDHRTSGEADTEARPSMSAMRLRTPADYLVSTGAGTAASLVMSTLRSRTPADDQASTGAGTAASLVMSTLRSETPR